MPNTKTTTKRRRIATAGIKGALAAASLVGTLSLWNLFARDLVGQASPPPAVASPPAESSRPVAMDLPPLPTLVPLETAAAAPVREAPAPAAPSLAASPPQPARIFLGGAKPQPPKPAPAARTRSSR
jgi:hypothetical protein